jgi:hypothetical protein
VPGQPVSRVLSKGGVSHKGTTSSWMIISLDDSSPNRSSSLPGIFAGAEERAAPRIPQKGRIIPAWPCCEWGFPGRRITAPPVVSYTTVSPLLPCGSGMFLWSYPAVTRSGGYPPFCPVQRGLSSAPLKVVTRSPGRPGAFIIPGVTFPVNRQLRYNPVGESIKTTRENRGILYGMR